MACILFFGCLGLSLAYTLTASTQRYSAAIKGGTALGLISSLTVIGYYLRHTRLRSHTNTLLFWRCVCDCGLSCLFLYYIIRSDLSERFRWSDLDDYYAEGDDLDVTCLRLAMIYQFLTFSSEAWLGCVSWDLNKSLDDPFTSNSQNMKFYHVVSWSFGVLMSLFMMAPHVAGVWYVGGETVDHYPICYLQNNKSEYWTGQTTIHILLYYLPVALIYLYMGATFYRTYRRFSSGGISETFQKRLHVLAACAINIFICFLYWTCWGLPYCLTYVFVTTGSHERNSAAMVAYWIGSFVLPCKGFADLLIFIFTNDLRDLWTNADIHDRLASPQMNTALRDEVLHLVTSGIRGSARLQCSCTTDSRKIFLNPLNETLVHGITLQQFWDMILKLIFNEEIIEETLRRSFDHRPIFSTPNEEQRDSELLARLTQISLTRTSTSVDGKHSGPPLGALRVSDPLTMPKPSEHRVSVASTERLTEPATNDLAGLCLSIDQSNGSVTESPFHEPATSVDEARSTFSSNPTLSQNRSIAFIDFNPHVFSEIRSIFRIDNEEYIMEWSKAAKVKLNEGGASNAFFFFSGNERFIAKSCTKSEMDTLRRISNAYVQHFRTMPNSFLLRIVGAHCLKMYHNEFYFYVMENLFKIETPESVTLAGSTGEISPRNDLRRSISGSSSQGAFDPTSLQERYDIKGSWVNRNAKPPTNGQKVTCRYCNQSFVYDRRKQRPDRTTDNPFGESQPEDIFMDWCPERLDRMHVPNLVLKDNDLNYRLCLDSHSASTTCAILEKDAGFLNSCGIMDYSLLIGVHNERHRISKRDVASVLYSEDPSPGSLKRQLSAPGVTSSHLPPSSPTSSNKSLDLDRTMSQVCRRDATHIEGPTVYYLGIIDILQEWTWGKRIERWLKVNLQGSEPDGLSAIEPGIYFSRFRKKVRDILAVETQSYT